MMFRSRKKVVVRTTANVTLAGYLPLTGIVVGNAVELLDTESRVRLVPLGDVKMICWVRDFNLTDGVDPERLVRRSFAGRPRSEGLWVRVTFAGGDTLEGLGSLDRTYLDDLRTDHGIYLVPPDVRANTQRVYVPYAAIQSLQVLGVITTPSKVRVPDKAADLQEELFGRSE